eukprot:g3379.t1
MVFSFLWRHKIKLGLTAVGLYAANKYLVPYIQKEVESELSLLSSAAAQLMLSEQLKLASNENVLELILPLSRHMEKHLAQLMNDRQLILAIRKLREQGKVLAKTEKDNDAVAKTTKLADIERRKIELWSEVAVRRISAVVLSIIILIHQVIISQIQIVLLERYQNEEDNEFSEKLVEGASGPSRPPSLGTTQRQAILQHGMLIVTKRSEELVSVVESKCRECLLQPSKSKPSSQDESVNLSSPRRLQLDALVSAKQLQNYCFHVFEAIGYESLCTLTCMDEDIMEGVPNAFLPGSMEERINKELRDLLESPNVKGAVMFAIFSFVNEKLTGLFAEHVIGEQETSAQKNKIESVSAKEKQKKKVVTENKGGEGDAVESTTKYKESSDANDQKNSDSINKSDNKETKKEEPTVAMASALVRCTKVVKGLRGALVSKEFSDRSFNDILYLVRQNYADGATSSLMKMIDPLLK